MKLGYVVLVRKGGKSSPQYELDQGEHTIGSSKDSNIRLKISNPLLLETHAVIRVNDNGVATILNKSTGAPVTVNGKIVFKPTILKHEYVFQVLDKEFQYFNEHLKDEAEDSEIFANEKKRLLVSSRRSVMPLSTLAKSPTYKTKANVTRTPSQRTPLTKSLNKSVGTPARRSIVAGIHKPSTPALKVSNARQSMPVKSFSRSQSNVTEVKGESFTIEVMQDIKESVSPLPQSSRTPRVSAGSRQSGKVEHNTPSVEADISKIDDKPSRLSNRISQSIENLSTVYKSGIQNLSGTVNSNQVLNLTARRSRISRSASSMLSGEENIGQTLGNMSTTTTPQVLTNHSENPSLIESRSTRLSITTKSFSRVSGIYGSPAAKNNRSSRLYVRSIISEDLPNLTDSEKSSRVSRSFNKDENLESSLKKSSSFRNYSGRSSDVLGKANTSVSDNDTSDTEDNGNESSQRSGKAGDTSVTQITHVAPIELDISKGRMSTLKIDGSFNGNIDKKSSFPQTRTEACKSMISSRNSSALNGVDAGAKEDLFGTPRKSLRSSRHSLTQPRCEEEGDMDNEVILNNSINHSGLDTKRRSRASSRLNVSDNLEFNKDTYQTTDLSRTSIQVNVTDVDEEKSSSPISLNLSSSYSDSNNLSQSLTLSEDEIPATQAVGDSDSVFLREEDTSANEELIKVTKDKSSSRISFTNLSSASVNTSVDLIDTDIDRASKSVVPRRLSRRGIKEEQSSLLDGSLHARKTSIIYIDSDSTLNSSIEPRTSRRLSRTTKDSGSSLLTDDISRRSSTRPESSCIGDTASKRSIKREQPSYASDSAHNSSSQASTVQNSRATTLDIHESNSKNRSLKRISTFDESTQDTNLNAFKNKSQQRKSTFEESTKEALPDFSSNRSGKPISILDDSAEVLSPVKPLSTRKSARNSEDNASASVAGRQSSIRGSPKGQLSENSSLTMTSLEQSTGSVISISSQSFSSFKKTASDEEKKQDETEIDVVNFTEPLETRSVRFSSSIATTPVAEERTSKRPSITAQMFDDVSCTSTPFHKPHGSKKNHEDTDAESARTSFTRRSSSVTKISPKVSNESNVVLASPKVERSRSASTSVVEINEMPRRRSSSRSSVSKNGEHNCVSCRHSSISRGRSLSVSKAKSHNSFAVVSGSAYEATSPIKRVSGAAGSKTGTPLLHRNSHISSVSENTPDKSANTEDETPKSHVKPTRRSSKVNQSAYNPVLEDITPVTPEKLQVSGFSEEAFKTPVNTPGLFESIRKSVIRSRKRHRESNGSTLKDSKRARVDFIPDEEISQVPVQEVASKLERPKQKSPLNRLSNFEGVKKLMKTPPKSPKNDLRNIPNLRKIMSPKQQNSPKNDLTAPFGVKRLLRSPKKQKHPANDLTNVSGVANIFNVSGIEILHQGSDIENSEDLFSKLTGKRSVRTYHKGKSLSPNKADLQERDGTSRKTMGDLPICSPRVQQWVDDHVRYNPEDDEDLFEKILEKPRRKSKIAQSVSIKETVREKARRRNTQGDAGGNTPNVKEWKTRESTKNMSEKRENLLENMSERPERKSRTGRSMSPRKATREASFRRKTHGVFGAIPDGEECPIATPSDGEQDVLMHVSERPKRQPRMGRSVSPNKAQQTLRNRRKTQGDFLKGTPDVTQWKQNNEIYATGVNKSILKNISDQPTRRSRTGRSVSPEKGVQALVDRRKTYGDFIRGTPDVDEWKSQQYRAGDSILEQVSDQPSRKTRMGRSVSPKYGNRTRVNRRKTQGDFLKGTPDVTQWKQNNEIYTTGVNESILKNISEQPTRRSRTGRSVSPEKGVQALVDRRKTYGDFIRGTPDVDEWKSQQYRAGDSILEQVSDQPSRKTRMGRSVSPKYGKRTRVNRRKTQGDFLKGTPDLNEWILEQNDLALPSSRGKARLGRSMSAKKPSQVDIRRRKTQGDALRGTPDVTQWKSDEIEYDDSVFENLSTQPSRKSKRIGRSVSPGNAPNETNRRKTQGDNLNSTPNVHEWTEKNSADNISAQQPKEEHDSSAHMSEKPSRKSRNARSISSTKPVLDNSNRIDHLKVTPNVVTWKTERVSTSKQNLQTPVTKIEPITPLGNTSLTNTSVGSRKVARISSSNQQILQTPKNKLEVFSPSLETTSQNRSFTVRAEVHIDNAVETDTRNNLGKLPKTARAKRGTRVAKEQAEASAAQSPPKIENKPLVDIKRGVGRKRLLTTDDIDVVTEIVGSPLANPPPSKRARTRRGEPHTPAAGTDDAEMKEEPTRSTSRRGHKGSENDAVTTPAVEEALATETKPTRGRGRTPLSPVKRGGRRGKKLQNELPLEDGLEATNNEKETASILPRGEPHTPAPGTDDAEMKEEPTRSTSKRGHKGSENDAVNTPAVEEALATETKPTRGRGRTPLSPVKRGGRRGKKLQNELPLEDGLEATNNEKETASILPRGEPHTPAPGTDDAEMKEEPMRSTSRRGHKGPENDAVNTPAVEEALATETKPTRGRGRTPLSPVKRGGRRGKKLQNELALEDGVEATNNEKETASLPRNRRGQKLSDNNEIVETKKPSRGGAKNKVEETASPAEITESAVGQGRTRRNQTHINAVATEFVEKKEEQDQRTEDKKPRSRLNVKNNEEDKVEQDTTQVKPEEKKATTRTRGRKAQEPNDEENKEAEEISLKRTRGRLPKKVMEAANTEIEDNQSNPELEPKKTTAARSRKPKETSSEQNEGPQNSGEVSKTATQRRTRRNMKEATNTDSIADEYDHETKQEPDKKKTSSRSKKVIEVHDEINEEQASDTVKTSESTRSRTRRNIKGTTNTDSKADEDDHETKQEPDQKKTGSRSKKAIQDHDEVNEGQPSDTVKTSESTRSRTRRNIKGATNTDSKADEDDHETKQEPDKKKTGSRSKKAIEVHDEVNEEQPSDPVKTSESTRSRTRRNIKGATNTDSKADEDDHETKQEPDKKKTGSRSKKAIEVHDEVNEEQPSDTMKTSKSTRGITRKNSEENTDEDVEFNRPIRGRPKKTKVPVAEASETALSTKKTRRGARQNDQESTTTQAEEAPKKATTTRGKAKNDEQTDTRKKPKNKTIEDVIAMDVDSPRTARAKRGINKKYSTDEYEVSETAAGRSKRKVHFDDDLKEPQGTPEVTTKRTRRTKK